MSSRFPIGVGQTTSLPGTGSQLSLSSSIRAIAAAPIIPASARSSASCTGVLFIGGSARDRSSSPCRLEQQVADHGHATPDHDHVGVEDVGEARQRDAEVAARPRRRPHGRADRP